MGLGGEPQPKLERIAERTIAESQSVMNWQRGEPDRRGPGCATEETRLVLLCALQRAAAVVESGKRA
jgi:hypothetical protein